MARIKSTCQYMMIEDSGLAVRPLAINVTDRGDKSVTVNLSNYSAAIGDCQLLALEPHVILSPQLGLSMSMLPATVPAPFLQNFVEG